MRQRGSGWFLRRCREEPQSSSTTSYRHPLPPPPTRWVRGLPLSQNTSRPPWHLRPIGQLATLTGTTITTSLTLRTLSPSKTTRIRQFTPGTTRCQTPLGTKRMALVLLRADLGIRRRIVEEYHYHHHHHHDGGATWGASAATTAQDPSTLVVPSGLPHSQPPTLYNTESRQTPLRRLDIQAIHMEVFSRTLITPIMALTDTTPRLA